MKKTLILLALILSSASIYSEERNFLKEHYDNYFGNTRIFVEGLYSHSYRDDERMKKDDYLAAESRLHLDTEYFPEYIDFLADMNFKVKYAGEFIEDRNAENAYVHTRELNFSLSPSKIVDVKVGRQVLTWGVGQYLVLNDFFPKDYESFFSGRHQEYLLKPSDAFKTSFFSELANLDVVLTKFEPYTSLMGKRMTFYNPFIANIDGYKANINTRFVENDLDDKPQISLRLYNTVGRYENALYYYRGYDPKPKAIDTTRANFLYYPNIRSIGASTRGPGLGGILAFEYGYQEALEDKKGYDKFIENSLSKFLAQYSKSFENDFDFGVQYYVEYTLKYDAYKSTLASTDYTKDRVRQIWTLMLNKKYLSQKLKLSLFGFYSPTDEDIYQRAEVGYDFTDTLNVALGVNLFWGRDIWTDYGQNEENSNVYLRVRKNF